jgi:phospholipase/carboxylesterase
MNMASSFVHKFEPGPEPPPVLLLHGTGGDEDDMLPLGREIAPGAALISPRGKVLENNMPRFFRRLREGVFDEDDVRRRAHELADFVNDMRKAHALPAPVALGFSNGANIAAAVLLLRPDALAAAILIRAMVPLRKQPMTDLSDKLVLLLSGDADPIASTENCARLAQMLTTAGAEVEHEIVPGSHAITQRDIQLSSSFFGRLRGGVGARIP